MITLPMNRQLIAKCTFLMALCFSLVECKKGAVTANGGSASNSGSLTVTKVFPTSAGSNWSPITTISPLRYYIKGLSLSIIGVCSPGISYIKVNSGSGYYSDLAYCDLAGVFTWNRTLSPTDFPSNPALEDDFTMTVDGFDVTDAAFTGASTSVNIRVDNVAPSTPAYITPSSATYVHQASTSSINFAVSNTASTDTMRIVRAGLNQAMNYNSGLNRWEYSDTLVLNSSTLYQFVATDKAGNSAPALPMTVIWSPDASFPVTGVYSAVNEPLFYDGPGSSDYNMEATMDELGDTSVSTGPPLRYLDLGFSKMVEELRGQ